MRALSLLSLPSALSSRDDSGGLCFEEDYDLEDGDLEDEEIAPLATGASASDWTGKINEVIRALNERGATDQILSDLQTAVRGMQEKVSGTRPEEFSRDERAMVGRYIRDNGRGEMRAYLVSGSVQIAGRSYEVPGFLDDVSDDLPEIQRAIQALAEQRFIIRTIKSAAGQVNTRASTPRTDAEIKRLVSLLPEELKRAFVDVAGSGAEFIPQSVLPTIVRAAEWQRRLAGQFETVSISSADALLPRMESGAIPYLISERSTDDPSKIPASSPVTADNTITPKTMGARVKVSANASEDALIAMMPLIRANLVEALIAGEEDAILNGDTAATHQDAIAAWNPNNYYGTGFLASAGGSSDHRRSFIGLRARAFDVSNTVDRSTTTFATLLSDQAQMVGQPGPNGSVLVPSPGALGTIAGLSQFATIDVVGPAMAANVRGVAVGSIAGMPVIPSEFAQDDMETSGLYTDGSGAKGHYSMVRTGRFRIFDRRSATIESAKEISTQMIELVITRRAVFAAIGSSTEKNVRYCFNV